MSYSAHEFVVRLLVSNNAASLIPSLEYYCLQAPACSYAPSTRGTCPKARLADYTQLQANVASLAAGCNLIELADASALYGAGCADGDDCSGAVIRYNDGRSQVAVCPIGTEMVITARGTSNAIQKYSFEFDPRVQAVNDEIPPGCIEIRNLIECPSGQATLRLTRSEEANYCDASDETTTCPFPVSGFAFGTCAASQPCPVARALGEEQELN